LGQPRPGECRVTVRPLNDSRGNIITALAQDARELPIEWRGVLPVPAEDRHGRPQELMPFWFALQLFPVAFFLGAIGAEAFIGLAFWESAVVIVVANLVGAAVVGAVSTMGSCTGAAQLPLARAPFGRGVLLPGVLASCSNIVFLSLGAVYGAQAVQVLIVGILSPSRCSSCSRSKPRSPSSDMTSCTATRG
jgi:purine-cytosine permease-like protein